MQRLQETPESPKILEIGLIRSSGVCGLHRIVFKSDMQTDSTGYTPDYVNETHNALDWTNEAESCSSLS
jgi:hypothetical protein